MRAKFGLSKLQAANDVARATLLHTVRKNESKDPLYDRQFRRGSEKIRAGYESFVKDGTLPEERRGRTPKFSLIRDEEVKKLCRDTIQKDLRNIFSANEFRITCSKTPKDAGILASNQVISKKTASFWLASLNMDLVESKKGIYTDVHERPDVQEYRKNMSTIS